VGEQCNKMIYRGRLQGSSQCVRKGVVERDGRSYCKQHDPVARHERAKARQEKFNREHSAKKEAFRLARVAPELLAALEAVIDLAEKTPGTAYTISGSVMAQVRSAVAKANTSRKGRTEQ